VVNSSLTVSGQHWLTVLFNANSNNGKLPFTPEGLQQNTTQKQERAHENGTQQREALSGLRWRLDWLTEPRDSRVDGDGLEVKTGATKRRNGGGTTTANSGYGRTTTTTTRDADDLAKSETTQGAGLCSFAHTRVPNVTIFGQS